MGGNSAKLTREQIGDLGGKLHQYTLRSLFGPSAAKADGQAVLDFEAQLEKLIAVPQDAPNTVIVVEDEASLYAHATTMAVWGPRGQPLVVASNPAGPRPTSIARST